MLAVVGCGGSDTTKRDTGVLPPPVDGGIVGTVKVDQVALIFGDVDIGTPSVPKTVTVTVAGAPVALNATVTGDGFAISDNTCKPLQPIGTCTISVVFAPTRVGAASGSLTVGGATVGVAVSLSGSGRQPGVFVASPEAFPLGTVLVGAASPITFDIIPTGTVASVSCLPSGADLTLATTTCPAAGVPVSAKCSYTFTFKAASAGDKAEAIVCSGGGTTRSVSVTAKVVTPSLLVVTPATQAFSAKVKESMTWTFNVSNTGGASTGNLTAAVTGAGFAISGNDCPPQLPGLGICKIQVTFTPATAGAVTGALTVTDATPGSTPGTAVLSGNGISSAVTIAPSLKDFGTVEVGKTASAVFTMANGGTAPTGIIVLTTTDAQFALASDLCSGKALDAKGQCTFGVTFTPTKELLQQAMLNANQTSDGASLASVALSGTGKAAPTPAKLTVTPPTLDFGTTGVGVPVGPKVFTITNTGGTASGALTTLKNDSTSSVGGASQFNITGNTCSAALAPGATCQVAVTFAPTITRSASAVIVVSDGVVSSSDGTVGTTAPGTVVGIALGIPPLRVTCPAFDADGTVVGTTESVVCTVNNDQQTSGETPQESGIITITPTSNTPTTGTFTLGTNNCTASLQPNTSCTFALVFTPLLKGKTAGSVSISSTNKGANNTTVEALGLLPVEVVERIADAIATGNPLGVVTDYDFGQVSMGASSNTTLTIDVYVRRNLGNINVTATDMQWPEDVTAPADFVTDGSCAKVSATAPTPKKTTAYCTMTVTFSPKSKKALTNVVTAASADGSASDTGSMKGSGTGPITLSPSKMTFAAVAVGSSSVTPMTLTVCNNAPNAATSAKLTITGANASDFAVVADTVSNQTLSPNGSANVAANCKFVQLRLDIPAGAATGPRTATVTVTGTIAGTLESGSAELYGSAVTGAGLSAVLDGPFADTPVTRTSEPVTVTVTNTGSARTDVIEFDIPAPWGDDRSEFTLTPPDGQSQADCTIDATVRLDPSTSCKVKVWFKPKAGLGVDVERRATLVVFSKVGGRKVLDLVGKATPQLTITPASVTIDPALIGGDPNAAPVKTLTITNNGADAAAVTVKFRNDTNETAQAQFRRVARAGNPTTNHDCPATIPAWGVADGSNTCYVDVQLVPVGLPGPRAATLDVETAGTQRASAKVSGSGVTAAKLLFTGDETVKISPSTPDRDFGTIIFDEKSTPQSFMLTNVGGKQAGKITVKLMNLSTHGTDETINVEHAKKADFAVTGTCIDGDLSVLGPGQSCSFQVVYQPTACEPVTTVCPYTTTTTDVRIAVFTAGNVGTASSGLLGAKLYGAGVAATGAIYAVGPNGLGAYDFGSVSAITPKTAVFTLINKSGAAFPVPGTATFADTALATVVTTDPTNDDTGAPQVRAGAGEFAISDGPLNNPNSCDLGTTSVAATNGYCLFTVTWTPAAATAVGTREVTMTIGTATSVNLFGRVAMPASLLAVPTNIAQAAAAIDFGNAAIGVDSPETRTITIRNVGEVATGAVKVIKTTTADADAGQVLIATGTTCQGASSDVPAGGTCIINIGVHPTGDPADHTTTPVQALRVVPFTGSTPTTWMRVSDIYVAWNAINPATIEPSAVTVKFDSTTDPYPGTSVLASGTSAEITLTNPGDSAQTGALSFRTDKDDFAVDLDPSAGHSTCLAPANFFSGLAPTIDLSGGTAATCTVRVVFSPTSLANPAKTGNLIVNSVSGATVTIALQGTALPALKVTGAAPSTGYTGTTTAAMASLNYPSTSITSYRDVTFTFAKATGSPATGLLSTGIGGGDTATPDQFKIVTDNCIGVSLTAAASTCTVTVRFAPSATGTNKNAVLQVTDSASGTPADSVSVALKGDASS